MASDAGGFGGHDPRFLRRKAIDTLLRCVNRQTPLEDERGFWATKVTAASRLLSHSEWAEERDGAPEQAFLALMGSPEKALAWCKAMVPKLEAMQARAMAERSEDDGEAGESKT